MAEAARVEPPTTGDERATLTAFLDYHRATLAWKCEGLTGEQLRQRAVPPSTLSLLGLVRHLAEVERGWFRRGFAGEELGILYCTDEDPDADFERVDDAPVDDAFATWREECERSRAIVAAAPSLDATFGTRSRRSLRWLLCHLIEEYARHNGHADLLRERLDGATGE
ncbi:MAG: DinB family protein [Candidatus Dormibacteraeota bacterium]|nr:DinB family protein [Candidatus Dormibacteraeota bacterium]